MVQGLSAAGGAGRRRRQELPAHVPTTACAASPGARDAPEGPQSADTRFRAAWGEGASQCKALVTGLSPRGDQAEDNGQEGADRPQEDRWAGAGHTMVPGPMETPNDKALAEEQLPWLIYY